jgi:hypothetical protein
LGGNQIAVPQRLKRLGWDAVESKKKSILEYLPEELEMHLKSAS